VRSGERLPTCHPKVINNSNHSYDKEKTVTK